MPLLHPNGYDIVLCLGVPGLVLLAASVAILVLTRARRL